MLKDIMNLAPFEKPIFDPTFPNNKAPLDDFSTPSGRNQLNLDIGRNDLEIIDQVIKPDEKAREKNVCVFERLNRFTQAFEPCHKGTFGCMGRLLNDQNEFQPCSGDPV